MQAETPKPAGRGRPRDPHLEAKALDAAIRVYAAQGWRGFTFDAVARAAGVGKSALYRRWPSRGDLLRETLQARWFRAEGVHTGSFEGDLRALAEMVFDALVGPHGGVLLHLPADLQQEAEVWASTEPYRRVLFEAALGVTRRAAARQELEADVSPSLIVDVIVGAISNRVTVTPPDLRTAMIAQRDQTIASLVRMVVRGTRR